ncbi:MAG: YbjN domain-containing protein, partial [Actinobacteria bacterium]|nr:YbjN domain-containing protein [Actinomycetota bacterium]
GVAFAINDLGDVFLVGRLPLNAVTDREIDRLLGAVLQYSDSAFNPLLELGFTSAIRREWAWRVSRGESLANLKAFEHLV